MKKNFVILIMLLLAFFSKAQQDPQYNMYQFNQMVINPAYAGARDAIAVVATHRNQWTGFAGAPKTSCISVHSPFFNNKLGAGLTIVKDAMGARSLFGIYANAAYILKLSSKFKLSFGLNAGYNKLQFDYDALTYKTTEPSLNFNQMQSYNKLDINSGLYLRSNSFFVGFSVTHLFASDVYHYTYAIGNNSLSYRLKAHAFLTIGNSFKLSDNFIFAPTAMIKSGPGKASVDVNLNFFLFKKLWLGVFGRGGYGPGFLLQYYITNKLKVGYSFDSGGGDQRVFGGSHEVMFGIDFAGTKNKVKVISPRFL